jgi:hypothetical protein
MKKVLAVLVVCVAFAAKAGLTNAPPLRPDTSVDSHIIVSPAATLLTLQEPKANEITKGSLTYSGIVIEAVKTKRPLQLLNPVAPRNYGSAEDNIVRDPIHQKVTGLKLFSIRF